MYLYWSCIFQVRAAVWDGQGFWGEHRWPLKQAGWFHDCINSSYYEPKTVLSDFPGPYTGFEEKSMPFPATLPWSTGWKARKRCPFKSLNFGRRLEECTPVALQLRYRATDIIKCSVTGLLPDTPVIIIWIPSVTKLLDRTDVDNAVVQMLN